MAANSDLIHTVECTSARVADNVMLKDCLHGDAVAAMKQFDGRASGASIYFLPGKAEGHPLRRFFINKESGYKEWLFGKVNKTMERVAFGKTELREHSDAMPLLKGQLETGLCKSINDADTLLPFVE